MALAISAWPESHHGSMAFILQPAYNRISPAGWPCMKAESLYGEMASNILQQLSEMTHLQKLCHYHDGYNQLA
jgi:hypothetical protein